MNLSVVEPFGNSLLILQALTIFLLSFLLAKQRWLEQLNRTALQRWHTQQTTSLSRMASILQDSSLQELFVLRRSLELAALDPSNTDKEQYQDWVQQLESLHISLNDWLKNISPSFVEDSLPLAVISYLNQLKEQEKRFDLSVESPENWQSDHCPNASKVILLFFEELKDTIGTPNGFDTVKLRFSQVQKNKHISVEFKQGNSILADTRKKVQNSCQVLSFLSRIQYRMFSEKDVLRIEFNWSS